MFSEEKKKKTNYGSIFVYCVFCLVFIMGVLRFVKPSFNLNQTLIKTESIVEEGFIMDVITPRHSRSILVPGRNQDKLSAATSAYRDRPPTSYCLKFESYTTMSKNIKNDKFESRPFSVGGYNWTFEIYPNGNKDDNANGFVSVYVRLQNSSRMTQDVYAEIKFFVYSRTQDKYFTYQDTEAKRFHLFKPEWGVSRFYAVTGFAAPTVGFIYNGGKSVFGVDIFVSPPFKKWEVLSYEENIRDPVFNWKLTNFSTRELYFYTTGPFSSGGRKWELKVYPNGVGPATGNSLSLFLLSASNESGYVQAKLRVLDQIRNTYVEKQVEGWPNATENGWGLDKFITFAEIRNASTGFLVNDTLIVGVQMIVFSKSDSFSV